MVKAVEGYKVLTKQVMDNLIEEGYHPNAVMAMAYIASKEGFIREPKKHQINTTWGFGVSDTSKVPKMLGWFNRDFKKNPLTDEEGVESMIKWFELAGLDLKSPKWDSVTPSQAMGLSSSAYHSGNTKPLKTALEGQTVPDFKGTYDARYPNTRARQQEEVALYNNRVSPEKVLPQLKDGTLPQVKKEKKVESPIDMYSSIQSEMQKEMETPSRSKKEIIDNLMGYELNPSYFNTDISSGNSYALSTMEDFDPAYQKAMDTEDFKEFVDNNTRKRLFSRIS